MSGNLFELRKDWPIPPTNNTTTATTSKLPIKIESQAQEQPTPSATTTQKAETMCMGTKLSPSVKTIEEDWDGDHQKQFQQSSPQLLQPQMQDLQYPQTQNYQTVTEHPVLQITDI